MNNCPKCEAEKFPGDLYCGMCGVKLENYDRMSHLTQKELTVEDVRIKLGMVYYRMGKYQEAIEVFEKTLKMDPDDSVAKQMLEIIKEKLFESIDD